MGSQMLWAPFMSLLVVWLLGVAAAHTLISFIDLLLLLAGVAAAVRLFQDRRNRPVAVKTKT